MKIIIAPDKFKNSLTALDFCDAVVAGIYKVMPNAEIVALPLADGGDGTIDIVNHYLGGETVKVMVHNPFFKLIEASYLYAEHSKTAFIEMAEASGYKLLKPEELDCKQATTYGTGELIADAIKKGAKTIILGIGGSATNDCGIGMAKALGYRFLDDFDEGVKPVGANLSRIKSIDYSRVNPKLKDITFKIACDVSNPLYGKHGAARVYAKQKGASEDDIDMLDQGLKDFAKRIEDTFHINPQEVKGAGAAGGMGIASKIFLNGDLKPGVELIKELADFNNKLQGADWIITGEGCLDKQTLSGKTIQGVLSSAKAKQTHVAAFCGDIQLPEQDIKDLGIIYSDKVLNYSKTTEDAMKNAKRYVSGMAETFAKTLLE
ncbi:glycerate kinase [Aestuariibaculum suncheonense]|uniref:Glycerate kinase n=1 Tax=Aestuariibaculum suncheonense TaxID=1028745 RepID=A0A8J6QDT5_9FLAO|nr:glycerate kinase [Aestuariibaculum suncheonense]MBD0834081.1 glycerate kinase [Aestuariibaculum suncheonense]